MNALGLSGTVQHGRSGTTGSDYREPEWPANPQKLAHRAILNNANEESTGFLLTQDSSPIGGALSANAARQTAPGDASGLTHVTLVWHKGRREDWLKFGKPVASRILDRHQRIESYSADQVFALVHWASNDYGTVRSALYIVRATGGHGPVIPVPQVDPGGDLLLSVHGWPKVAQVFELIDAIEASGIDPCEVAPDHWRHIHNRMAAREAPRGYSRARHNAWLQRRELLP